MSAIYSCSGCSEGRQIDRQLEYRLERFNLPGGGNRTTLVKGTAGTSTVVPAVEAKAVAAP